MSRDRPPLDPRPGSPFSVLVDAGVSESTVTKSTEPSRAILHICRREMLRPLRDEILRISGFYVDSTLETSSALALSRDRSYDLVLVDVEGETGVALAEHLCSEIKTARKTQKVAFVCNWRVADLTDCPDEILRTEFNPRAFVQGVRGIVSA